MDREKCSSHRRQSRYNITCVNATALYGARIEGGKNEFYDKREMRNKT